ncbi:AAA family ATPase [Actinomadura parmotrematis]|uniref:AAA family ATPase n=1 Tax=Actinomadura parmotrematis TaxID=2864039 RepID=A0ABS7G429_9ACTN|nr:AAA family ATPase [Actinomadura parmotrematis]MBW8487241.1 AAA family ATPase [Actinomadura parmotrematis]
MTTTKQRPGWHPERLRERREAHGLSLEAAGECLREVAERAELRLAANFQTIWSHENGNVYPGPHYRRAYCLLYQATEPDLGFRLPLPSEQAGASDVLPVPTPTTNPVVTEEAAAAIAIGLNQVTDAGQRHGQADGEVLKSRVVSAWRGRMLTDGVKNPILVLVGGYAGSGKTEFARFLGDVTGWAFLDKDSLTRRLVERLLVSLGGDPHDRHTDLYMNEIRPLEYKCLMDTANDNIDCGISTILTAPFIAELNDEAWMSRLTNRCKAKGMDVAAIWVRCDTESMREYIEFRDAPRDAWKLANWDTYVQGIDTEHAPPGVHLTIDNRHGAAVSIADQTREALRKLLG